MKLEIQSHPEVVASWFNDDEVKQWLQARASLYGIRGLVLCIESVNDALACCARLEGRFEYGDTLDEAADKIRRNRPTPLTLRQQANILLQQAAELESESDRAGELRTEAKKSQEKPNFHD